MRKINKIDCIGYIYNNIYNTIKMLKNAYNLEDLI